MNIGIRLHDTVPGTLKERLSYVRGQGFTCAHIALGMTLPGFSMQDSPQQLTPELAETKQHSLQVNYLECTANMQREKVGKQI